VAVGGSVGAGVEVAEGGSVGTDVGETVGDGRAVGDGVGVLVGAGVNVAVGISVGVGVSVGAGEGTGVEEDAENGDGVRLGARVYVGGGRGLQPAPTSRPQSKIPVAHGSHRRFRSFSLRFLSHLRIMYCRSGGWLMPC
jgi:hypothetical protein